MKTVYLRLGVVLFMSVALSACKKNTTSDTADLSFGVQTDSPTSNFTATSNPNTGNGLTTTTVVSQEAFRWTGGTANISKFKLEATKDGVPLEIKSSNLTNIDLFALTPLLAKVTIPKGVYTNVEVRVVFNQVAPGGAMPLVLHGTFTTAIGTQWPVEFDFNEDAELSATLADITVDGTKNLFAKMNMHLNKFLTSITAQQVDATTRTNGTIIISSTSNPVLYAKIKANLLLSVGSIFEAKSKI